MYWNRLITLVKKSAAASPGNGSNIGNPSSFIWKNITGPGVLNKPKPVGSLNVL